MNSAIRNLYIQYFRSIDKVFLTREQARAQLEWVKVMGIEAPSLELVIKYGTK